eukprot:scaffold16171_cov161-Amphora_coffeaeformis.AAC.2
METWGHHTSLALAVRCRSESKCLKSTRLTILGLSKVKFFLGCRGVVEGTIAAGDGSRRSVREHNGRKHGIDRTLHRRDDFLFLFGVANLSDVMGVEKDGEERRGCFSMCFAALIRLEFTHKKWSAFQRKGDAGDPSS